MIVLKELRELQLTEIAARLRLPLGTVSSRPHRARRELADAVRGSIPRRPTGRTIREVCHDVQDFERLLEAWLAEDDASGSGLAGTERAACARHLDGCPRCRELAELGALGSQDSLAAAVVDPGPGFVEEILARTSGAPRPAAVPSADARGWWAGLWPRLVRRPRFAWEVAYVLTLVLAPLALWAGAPEQTVALVGRAGRAGRIGSVAVAAASRDLTVGTADRAGSLGAAAGSSSEPSDAPCVLSERGREKGPEDLNQKKGDAR